MRSAENLIRVVVAAVLGGIGGAAGFKHTHDWAVANGQHGWLAWAVAVVIEGIVIVAGFEIRRDHVRGYQRKVTFPVVVLVVGFGVQMAAQVALAPRTPPGWLLAAVPALGFLVVVKLLLRSAGHPTTTVEPQPAARPVTAAPVNPVPATAMRLPAAMRDTLLDTARRVAADGRPLTPEDVRMAVRVSPAMAAQLVADLTTAHTVNGHRHPNPTDH